MFEELTRKMNKFWNDDRTLQETDPEFISIFSDFAYGDVVQEPGANSPAMDDHTRCIAILAALIGAQGMESFTMMMPIAYRNGVTSIEMKEIIYQSTAYVGFAHALPFLRKINDYLNAENVDLPLASQKDPNMTSRDQRRQAGEDVQVEVFGEGMHGFAESGPEDTRHINAWLSENCFGDYYTRSGLDLKTREMITFCFLVAQGGCEPQAIAHAKGNMNIGNDKDFLIAVVSQILPYIGYPRALNAIQCIRKASEQN